MTSKYHCGRQWYAIRTNPGAQSPKREKWREWEDENGNPVSPHWRSGINPAQSAVEFQLEQKQFVYYMPAEYVVVRSRTKTGLYTAKRFALLKGYAFVEAHPTQWPDICKLSTVYDLVRNQGEPMVIDLFDIHRLRMIEANSKAAAQVHARRMAIKEDRGTRQSRKTAIKAARRKLFPSKSVKLLWGDKVGREATVEAWKDDGFVQVLLGKLDAGVERTTVPYEYLRAAE